MSEPLTDKQRKLLGFALFSTAMKIGPNSFLHIENIVKKLDVQKEFVEYADSWIKFPKKDKEKLPTDQKQFYAVEYSGFWNIQTGPMYGDKNILDAESAGEDDAEKFATLIAKLLNEHYTEPIK